MPERRYDDDEVKRIFDAASRAAAETSAAAGGDEGMSLMDLKRIGEEVGLPPERIEAAARAIDHAPTEPDVVRDFGLPVTVGRSVALPRAPDDAEWAQLVAVARRTFNAQGKVDPVGHHWWNGNLTMTVEPTYDGHRLRLRTTKGDGRMLTRIGLGAVAFALISVAATLFVGGSEAGAVAGLVGGYGALAIAINAFRLPSWARRRSEQMALVAGRAVDVLADPGE